MSSERNNARKTWVWALALLGLSGLGAVVHYVNQNYDVRLVRIDADAVDPGLDAERAAGSEFVTPAKPAPIVVRLACADAGSALRDLRSPSRSLRDQLRRGDPKAAPAAIPNMRCKQPAEL